jgi:hypothetical protein
MTHFIPSPLPPPGYDDWRWGGSPINPPGLIAAAVLTEFVTGVDAYLFTNNTAMSFVDQQLPHDYQEGTALVPHIHFAPTTTATYTGQWSLTYVEWLDVTPGTAMVGPTTITAAFNSAMTANQVQTVDFNAVLAGANRKISSCLNARLTLTLSAGTSLALVGLDAHYLKDALGSSLIAQK